MAIEDNIPEEFDDPEPAAASVSLASLRQEQYQAELAHEEALRSMQELSGAKATGLWDAVFHRGKAHDAIQRLNAEQGARQRRATATGNALRDVQRRVTEAQRAYERSTRRWDRPIQGQRAPRPAPDVRTPRPSDT